MTNLPIQGLDIFLTIADRGSLRAAASQLGLQPPSVSYQLSNLERRIGTPLFVRTTRSLSLTDAGQALLARARPAMTELGEAVEAARHAGASQRGHLRITLPFVAYQLVIAPHLKAFRQRYPEIALELSFNEAFEDIAAEGFHAGVRLGGLIQEDMIAVRLSPPMRDAIFGSASYLAERGRPKRPEDLLDHDCISYRYIASGRLAPWQVKGPEGPETVEVNSSLVVNSTTALIDAAEAGLGLAWLFRPAVEPLIKAGRLVSLLQRYTIERPGYFLYYPRANARIEALRLFIDFLRERQKGGGRARSRPART